MTQCGVKENNQRPGGEMKWSSNDIDHFPIKADPEVLNCFIIQKFTNQFLKSVYSYRVILGNFVLLVLY